MARIPSHILDDLASRFLINIPYEVKEDAVRICFKVEEAWWFFQDFYMKDAKLGRKPVFNEFAAAMFQHVAFLRPMAGGLDRLLREWRAHKLAVPTCGAVLLSPALDKVLLVQDYHNSWGFPKGKVNLGETPEGCAVRETREEVGYDIGPLLRPEEFLEHEVRCRDGAQSVRLYLIPGVEEVTMFGTRTRGEVRAIQWFPLASLPESRRDKRARTLLGRSPNQFFMAFPFIREIRAWAELAGARKAPEAEVEVVVEVEEGPLQAWGREAEAFMPRAWAELALDLGALLEAAMSGGSDSRPGPAGA
jgi:mRNA-decapping enzyme subunit 2